MERSTRKSGKDILFGKGKSAKGRETLRERVRAVSRTDGGEKLIGAEEETFRFPGAIRLPNSTATEK